MKDTGKLVDDIFHAIKNDRGASIYFREMLKIALSHPLNQWERDYAVAILERDLKDFVQE
jgi:hypothetical protein